MRTYILLLLLTVTSWAQAQKFPSDLWHDGKMVLVTDDTIVGKLKYSMDQEIVQVRSGDKLFTFGANKILYFELFDKTVDYHRQFYTIPYGLISSYKVPVIFEVLIEGNITLLAREKITLKSSQISSYSYRYAPTSYSREVLTYDYYFLDKKGTITHYSLKKKDLLRMLKNRQQQVSRFMQANNLHADRRSDLIRIISFYNGII
jgi:hypothetical protein